MGNNNGSNSWTVRILSLLIACGLWLYVMNEQNPFTTRTFTVPLGKQNLAEDMVVNDMPENVKVKITGPRASVSSLAENTIQAYVDFSGASKGRNMYNVVGITPVGEVIDISPSLLQLFVDDLGKKTLEVEPRIVGIPNSGVTVGKMGVDPIRVEVTGASSRINEIDKVVVLVDISNKDKNFEDDAAVVAISKDGSEMYDMAIVPSRVHVSAAVVKQLITEEVKVNAVLSGNLPTGFTVDSITVTPQKVKLTAEPGILSKIAEIKTAPVVLDKLTGDIEVQMPLSIPEQVLSDTHNVMVNIKLKKVGEDAIKTN